MVATFNSCLLSFCQLWKTNTLYMKLLWSTEFTLNLSCLFWWMLKHVIIAVDFLPKMFTLNFWVLFCFQQPQNVLGLLQMFSKWSPWNVILQILFLIFKMLSKSNSTSFKFVPSSMISGESPVMNWFYIYNWL